MPIRHFDGIDRRPYKEIRSEIRTGDLLLASGNYPVSRIIRHFSNSMFSHVGFVFPWNDRILLLESVEDDGVRAVPLSQYVEDYECCGAAYDGRLYMARYKSAISNEAGQRILSKAADELNRKYDKEEIGRILARVTLGLGHHGDDRAYICSEFVDICFKEAGIVFPRDDRGFIFPEHIAADANVAPLWEIALP